jgi:ABC-type Na+ efflux pump permease subunit
VLRQALFIARHDLSQMLRQRETLLWVFLMPPLFFYFIGTVTGGMGGPPAPGSPAVAIALVAPDEPELVIDELTRRLEELNFRIVRPESQEDLERYSRRLTVPEPPADYATVTDAVLAGEPVELSFLRRGDPLAANYDRVRVTRAVYTVLADIAVTSDGAEETTATSIARLADMPRALTLDVQTAGKRIDPPIGFAQSVPGITVMFTMLVMLTAGAGTLVVERNQGLLRRLASAPISRGALVAGKLAARAVLGIVQIGYGMLMGALLFAMDWGGNIAVLLLVLAGWAVFNAALGMLLANLVRTEAQMAGVGVIFTMGMAALGGCWWPIELTPAWMQSLAMLLPSGWTMDALHRLVSFGEGPVAILPHLALLGVGGLILAAAAARSFRYE